MERREELPVQVVIGGVMVKVIESCNNTWLFDLERSRFRRVPRGVPLDLPATSGEWQQFASLEIDPHSDAFEVALDERGSRLLRSWRHQGACVQCDERITAEVSKVAVAAALRDGESSASS
ncbi:MAG: hypothetical protein ABIW46_02390 [Acidimicrobiales bacterium]